jgi:Apea-like HEPN
MKQPPKTDIPAMAEYRLRQHYARIATAAEWMFDAETEAATAMTFVQVAIAFEALYGGSKDDSIGKTLSNRVVYSLGKSPANREDHISAFLEFYSTRSIVVHSEATRLSKLQRTQFANGKQMLRQCLRHEMALLSPVGALTALAAQY